MRNLTISATRASIGALASVMLLTTYVPAAHAESPPEVPGIDLIAPPTKPEPPVEPEPPFNPCGPGGCVVVDLTDCLDLVKGCEPKEPIEHPDFELCLNLKNVPCKPEIDDFANPPGPADPGEEEEEGGEEEEPVEPEAPVIPENPELPETPETPEVPEVPETPETPEAPETPETPTPGGEAPTPSSETPDPADIDTPRPGNPNFTG